VAIEASKTWIAGEVLAASDLNAEFVNILSGGQLIGFPRTFEADFGGQVLWLDADKDTSITADTDDQIDIALSGTDLFYFDGTETTPVNGFGFLASSSGDEPAIVVFGADTHIDFDVQPKGDGNLTQDGTRVLLLGEEDSAQFILPNQIFGFG
jgi:hypothetical protein